SSCRPSCTAYCKTPVPVAVVHKSSESRTSNSTLTTRGTYCPTADSTNSTNIESQRILVSYGIVIGINVKIETSSTELDRIFTRKSLQARVIVTGAVVIEACSIVFPARVLEGIRG